MDGKNIRGLYKVKYGYSNHTHLFIITREQFEVLKEQGCIELETSKHNMEEMDTDKIELVTEDQAFITEFEKYNLTTNFYPEDYIE
jgi:hypothetical protein